jgi:hypothetical protein
VRHFELLLRVLQAFETAVNAIVDAIAEELESKVYSAYQTATAAAESAAHDTVQKWGLPINREDRRAGGLHWGTYKAIVRRDGVFTNPTILMSN